MIVEVVTDDGIAGIGEAPFWECESEINDHMASRLIDADPFDIESMKQCARRFKEHGPMDQYYNPGNPQVYARIPLG